MKATKNENRLDSHSNWPSSHITHSHYINWNCFRILKLILQHIEWSFVFLYSRFARHKFEFLISLPHLVILPFSALVRNTLNYQLYMLWPNNNSRDVWSEFAHFMRNSRHSVQRAILDLNLSPKTSWCEVHQDIITVEIHLTINNGFNCELAICSLCSLSTYRLCSTQSMIHPHNKPNNLCHRSKPFAIIINSQSQNDDVKRDDQTSR